VNESGVRVGIDIGGTFTDLVLVGLTSGLHISKVSSTKQDPSIAVAEGLQTLLDRLGLHPGVIAEIVHGTTVGSNTILEKSGARTGLITTRGFRDVLEIGRIRTPTMFDLAWDKPEPLVERRFRREVTERIAAGGSIITPLDLEEVAEVGRQLVSAGVEAIAVCFINSYANPQHEKAAADLLRRLYPTLWVTASHEVLPEMKEYERTSTTVVNAYLLPRMQNYLERLTGRLRQMGIQAPLQVMASNGGIMGAAVASKLPVFAVASGPAGGVTGTAALSRDLPGKDFIIFDMGGTTAKASILDGGRPALVTEYEFRDGMSSPSRFVKGGGYMLKVPAVDIAEVGAGGGSIASVDKGGLLRVGPESAGADPGPACYGRGNDRPTVTDANMCLGYLNPEFLAGGSLKVHRGLAEAALLAGVGSVLGLPPLKAAHGVRQLANASMARAIRSVTVERGKDPREMAMIAFGGSGPLHAVDVARLLGIRQVIVPVLSGVFAAAGMLSADVEHNFMRASPRLLAEIPADWLTEQLAALERTGRSALASEGYDATSTILTFFVDLRYAGQSSELTLSLAPDVPAKEALSNLAERFRKEHYSAFGYATEEPIELVNLRLTCIGRSEHRLNFSSVEIEEDAVRSTTSVRTVSLDLESGFRDVPLARRSAVGCDPRAGPAVIESYDTTILVPKGCTYRADPIGNIIIDIGN
jgi:N-methylhydantoinase A